MMEYLIKQIKISLLMLATFSIIAGIFYPVCITLFAQAFFPWKANGSIVKHEDKVVGSLLIGQDFHSAKYFWGRPSATKPNAYNPMASGGSNLGSSNPELFKIMQQRFDALSKSNPGAKIPIPIDLLTASASGLDPHISSIAAYYQNDRIAKARKIDKEKISNLIKQYSRKTMYFFGSEYVNVLEINLALDHLSLTGQ